jgi:uncharacterized membrane protein
MERSSLRLISKAASVAVALALFLPWIAFSGVGMAFMGVGYAILYVAEAIERFKDFLQYRLYVTPK